MTGGAEVWCVVVAAGSGTRFGSMKQFAALDGDRVVDLSVGAAAQACDGVVVVVPADALESLSADPPDGADVVVAGGPTRSASSLAGVEAVPASAAVVLVHDAARPLATANLFAEVAAAVRGGADAVIPVVPVTDSIRAVDGTAVDRDTLRAVQTPQGFEAGTLRRALGRGHESTDDAQAVEREGAAVTMVPGEVDNVKITRPADLGFVNSVLRERAAAGLVRDEMEGSP